jgi:hypothetical protein
MMKDRSTYVAISVVALLLLSWGCQDESGLPMIEELQRTANQIEVLDTAYVEIYPPFGGFSEPEDVMIGNDQLLYVADTRANRVVMLNRAGWFMSARTILHPVSVAQDSRLDLLVGGEMVASNGDTIGAIFRIHLVSATEDSAHHLEVAPMDTVWQERAHGARRFPGVTVFGDNWWLAVRTGPDNSSFIDPDARVLLFDNHDAFVTPLSAFATGVGTGITYINKPTAIASFPASRDFVLTQSAEGVAYGAIWMTYQKTTDFEGWIPQFDPARAEDRGVDFLRPNRYLLPDGVAIDRSRRDIFIADAALDSVFKFTSRGVFKSESFGVVRSQGAMRRPTGLAFYGNVLYVLDGQLGQVLRFRLSTDIAR